MTTTSPPTPERPTLSSEEEEDEEEEPAQCWLCNGTRHRPSNPLLRGVCRCSGSAGVVHQKCIDDLVLNHRYKKCSVCRWAYKVDYSAGEGIALDYVTLRALAKGRMLVHQLVLPVLWRVLKLVLWVCFSYAWIPFEVGSIFYREALRHSRATTPLPLPTTTTLTTTTTHQWSHVTSEIVTSSGGKNRTVITRSSSSASTSSSSPPASAAEEEEEWSWWWWFVYAWTLGTLIGVVIRLVLVSWDGWRGVLLGNAAPGLANVDEVLEHLNEAVEEEEEALEAEEAAASISPWLQGELREVFELVREAEKWVGYDSIATLSLCHVVVGSAAALVLSTRQWAIMLAGFFVVCAVWELYVPRRALQDERHMFDEIHQLRGELTEMEVLHLFGITVLRFAGISFSSSAACFVTHVCLAPFFGAHSTPQSVLEELTVVRLVLYLVGGVGFGFACSLFDKVVTCGLFASGVDLFIFHSSQPGDELQAVFVEALALRSFGGPMRALLSNLCYVVVLCLLMVLLFVLPLGTVAGVRHLVFGDAFVTYAAGRGAPLFGLMPPPRHVAVGLSRRGPAAAGEVALPMHLGFPLFTPPAYTAPWTLLQGVLAHPPSRHTSSTAAHLTETNTTGLPRMTVLAHEGWSAMRQTLRAGNICPVMWEEVTTFRWRQREGAALPRNESKAFAGHHHHHHRHPSPSAPDDEAEQHWLGPPLHSLTHPSQNNSNNASVAWEANTTTATTAATVVPCEVVSVLFVVQLWEWVAHLAFPRSEGVKRLTVWITEGLWWMADLVLRHPHLAVWTTNLGVLTGLCASLLCLVSSPYHRLLLRQLRAASRWYGWLLGMEEYLFSSESTETLDVFLASSEDSEFVVPNTPLNLLFVSRKDQMPPEKVPSYLFLRRIAFFMLYYPTVVLCLWQIPILGALLWISVTTLLVPLLVLSVQSIFFLWHRRVLLHQALLPSCVFLCTIVIVLLYLLFVVPLRLLVWWDTRALVWYSYIAERKLVARVVVRSSSAAG